MASRFIWLWILGVSILLGFLTLPFIGQMPAGMIPDDGYFYSKIASNIPAHHFSSFDGINPTDGYHQLWQYLLAGLAVPVQALTTNRHILLSAFLSLDFFFLLGAAWMSGRNWTERGFVFAALAGCEFLMEGHLLAFLIAVAVLSLLNKRETFALVACALIPLARIDSSLIPFALAIALLFTDRRTFGFKLLAALAAGVALHFAMMLGLHGHLWSVSSELKSGAGHSLRLFANLGQRTPTLPVPFEPQGAFCVLLGGLSLYALLQKPKGEDKTVLLGAWLGVAAFTFGHLCLSDVHPWYYTPALLGFPLVLIQSGLPQWKNLSWACAAASLLLLGAFFVKTVKNRGEASPVVDFVAQMNQMVPANERIYMVDGSGYLGFYSDASLINGDGLVNSHEYAAELKAGRLANYLQKNQVRYFITNKSRVKGETLINIGGLHISEDQADPVLVKNDNGKYFFTNFVLWRLR